LSQAKHDPKACTQFNQENRNSLCNIPRTQLEGISRYLAGFLPIQPSRGLLAFERVLAGLGRLPAANVVGSLSWPKLLKSAARGKATLFAEFRGGAGKADTQERPEVQARISPYTHRVDVRGELEAILAGVLGEKIGPDQPLMEVNHC